MPLQKIGISSEMSHPTISASGTVRLTTPSLKAWRVARKFTTSNKQLRVTVLCDGDDLAQLLTTGEVVVDFLPCCVTSVQCLPEIPAQVRQPKERRKNHEANTT
jgi:hypothetical protein